MYSHERTDFIETNLRPSLEESVSQHISSMESTIADFDKYRARLQVVREEKHRQTIEFMGMH